MSGNKMNRYFFLFLGLVFLCSLMCGYPINYRLDSKHIFTSNSPKDMKVQVANFTDERVDIEKEKSARKSQNFSDLNDYTYDKEFKGNVNEEITKMLVKHLNYSKVFNSEVTLSSFSSEQLMQNMNELKSLKDSGIDAIIIGKIESFYGYYDQSIGRQLLYSVPLGVLSGLLLNITLDTSTTTETTYYWYGPGLVLGYYLESLHKRKVEYRVKFSAELLSTSEFPPKLWEDSFEISFSDKTSMPGFSTVNRKYEVVLNSLRDAVNKFVESLENKSF